MSEDTDIEYVASDEGEDFEIGVVDSDQEHEDEQLEIAEKLNKQLEELKWKKKLSASDRKKKLSASDRKKKATKKDITKSECKLMFKPSSVLDCFHQFMTPEVKEIIVKYSNLKGKGANEDKEKFKEIDMVEFDAFLGLLVAGGVTRQTKVPFDSLWSKSSVPSPIFSTVIGRDRMREIKKNLCFDDKKLRDAKLKSDKLAEIREIYDMIVYRFKSSYIPSEDLTVDERISPFKGRVAFKVYMPNKPQKYGIKLWLCCDAVNYYVTNFKVYTGKEGGKREVNQGENVVMELTKHLKSVHNVTTDNFFTSVPLAYKLLNRHPPMTLLGTLRSNRKFIPDFIKSHSKKEKYSSCFAFSNDMMMVSYIYKENKSVIVLSSSKHNDKIMEPKENKIDKKKPEVIHDYNHTKCGVDKLNEMTKSMSCIRATRRWTLNLFENMLDMICFNAYVCYTISVDETISRKDFMIRLYEDLCKPHAVRRLSVSSNPTSVKSNIRRWINDPQVATPTTPKEGKPGKNEKCDLCVGKRSEKKYATRYCSVCSSKICSDHQQAPKCNNCP